MKKLAEFLYAVLGGVCISIGGAAFLSVESRVAGALFFTVGLFTIVTMGFNLYTGKVCYVFDNRPSYLLDVLLIWLGNLAGCLLTGSALRLTRIAGIAEKAQGLCSAKLSDGLLSVFILAVLCNIMIYIAVDGFKNNPHELGKYLSLFLGVAVFILCGFEHCVANMFYFTVAGVWSGRALLYMAVMTLGNAAGGVIFPLLRRLNACR